jgi:HK97 gp10 family phage protein
VPDEIELKLEGVDELLAALRGMPQKLRNRAIRAALRKAARVISVDAKSRTPVMLAPVPFRRPGTVKRRISVRNSKFARQAGDEGVFVGVKPLRGRADTRRYGKASSRNPNDPFYWRFLEFGTRKMTARPFLGPAANAKGNEAIRSFLRESLSAIEKLNRKGA